ncbi:translation initiation factor 2 [Pseudomonas fluorescens]|uniref:translation initiation factor 2 n=1 Tax=Pseudomonas fluorescens group TaxID=136843 RepID=UPI00177CDD4F|nr:MULTISPECIES: translation initiation factor 2 [Pseudomonas fluorescens group]MBD8147564.1 translation initiation factor 2 [Pseudomonas fluorescens]MBD8177098.1 translation initiation factor 2 [Pseudomonas fluorescens]MBD8746739.1 translation initiation factor 2 [Pseudomonas fluorescens]MBD8751165.1 translation initiation factor 2 [Pseudomonas fluorescens]MBD8759965.1 translation initiation factor 2 [Pseudomonas fluorescens]
MRLRQLCLLTVLMIGATAQAEELSNGGSSTPLSLSAGSQITELQQRLKESEGLREALSKQLQSAQSSQESAQLSRLRQENQRLAQQLKETQGGALTRWLTEQQQWFVIGAAVALIALLCGIFASGGHRRRRQWLN